MAQTRKLIPWCCAGVQIVLLVFMGWGFARWGLLEGERFMGQINVLILRAAFPALTIYLLVSTSPMDSNCKFSRPTYSAGAAKVSCGLCTVYSRAGSCPRAKHYACGQGLAGHIGVWW